MKKLALILLLALPFKVFSQVVWSETFDDLPNNATYDNGATAWSTIQPAGNSGNKMFQTQTYPGVGRVFIVNDTGNEGVWRSQVVNISGYSEVAIEAMLGVYWANTTDYIRAYYRVDGGVEVLFAEKRGEPAYQTTVAASAIVSGNSLQIIIRARDTNTGSYYGYPRMVGFDNVRISRINYLYSRRNGDWNSNNTWSLNGYNGNSCNCTPDENSHVFIGNYRTVTMYGNATSAGVSVANTGTLAYDNDLTLNIVRGGVVDVNYGGVIGFYEGHTANLSMSTYNYNINVDGDFRISNLQVSGAAVSFSGSGIFVVYNNASFSNLTGQTISNDIQGDFYIINELRFESSSSNITINNSGNWMVGNVLRMENNGVTFNNSKYFRVFNVGTLYSSGTNVEINNEVEATFWINGLDVRGDNFIVNNRGAFAQFANIINNTASTQLNNLEDAFWYYNGYNTTNLFNTAADNNSFVYYVNGNQLISTPSNGSYQNLYIYAGGTKVATNNIDVEGTLYIAGASLDMSVNNYALSVGGNWEVWYNNDYFVERASTVTFNGSGDQSFNVASGRESFYNVVVNKSGGSLILNNSDLTVANQLNLQAGEMNLVGRNLTISNPNTTGMMRGSGYIKSETSSAYGRVIWNVNNNTGSYVYPFGRSASEYIPFVFDITSAASGSGNVSVATYGTANNNLPYPNDVGSLESQSGVNSSDKVVNRFWQIDVNGFTTNPVATVTFTVATDEMESLTSVRAQRWNSAENKWDAPLPNQNMNTVHSVVVPGVTNFSPWTLADTNQPLPIELNYFVGHLENDQVQLKWETALEINNDYFIVERTQDFENYERVGVVQGAGTSNDAQEYALIDKDPLVGKSYYKLTQVDFDGTEKSFELVPINYESQLSDFALFPNPNNGEYVDVLLTGDLNGEVGQVQIVSLNGIIMYEAEVDLNVNKFRIDFRNRLSPGVYMVKIGDDLVKKLLVK